VTADHSPVDDHPQVEPQPGDPVRSVASPLVRVSAVVAVLRLIVPIAVLPFAPALVPERVTLLLLLRPGKEVVLLGGGLSRAAGDPSLLALFLAYLPLMTVGIWVYFVIGRAYGPELRAGEGPEWLQRAVPADKLLPASRVLTRRGPAIAILGRLAGLPASVIAAAAGASDVHTVRFLAADLAGILLTFSATVAIGYALGDAYERGGAWLTVGGLVLFAVLAAVFARWIRREAERE
jgi:membrane protein DedA with SNARE-associated domain